MESKVLVYKAVSIIQRDALVHTLRSEGLRPETPPREISRKVSDDTIDISYEGFSVFFDGFPIHVYEGNQERALEIIKKFLAEVESNNKDVDANVSDKSDVAVEESDKLAKTDHFRKFCFGAIFSLVLPVVMHVFAVYHLYFGFKNKEVVNRGFILISLGLYGVSVYFLYNYLVSSY